MVGGVGGGLRAEGTFFGKGKERETGTLSFASPPPPQAAPLSALGIVLLLLGSRQERQDRSATS